ncbi:MAG: nicotinate (nicotinamide) nucleotide adenylyltransferase [Rickettsiales bacterium]|nr:nicotinate (nicotinamide) nucleotide adenylyltransferase [Rickettsiales bacterium]
MKVGLLGGSFNPPHQGHLHISNLAVKKLGLNQVWWIPTAHNPLKDKSIYDTYENRVEKCQILTAKNPRIYVKKFDEIYTEILLKKLKARYKNIEFFWLMGADNLEKFHQWEGFKKLVHQVPLMIFSREKNLRKVKKTKAWKFILPSNYKVFFSKNLDISSTEIRAKNRVCE